MLQSACVRSANFGRAPGLIYTSYCRTISASAVNQKEKNLIHVSILRTDKFQQSLPRLPIPKLSDTLDRYLDSQRALLSEDSPEFRHTQNAVKQFESGAGPNLDQALRQRDKANKHTSYIADFWYDAYLKARVPIVFNYNPFIMLKDEKRPEYSDQLIRATNLIVSSLRFRNAHQQNCLDPDIYHMDEKKSNTAKFRKIVKMVPDRLAWFMAYFHNAYPLDMSQYPRLFASTRLPLRGRDTLVSHPTSRHIVVVRNGHFYTFDVYEPDGHIVDPQRIHANLKYIASQPLDEKASSLPLGLLTTLERDAWADLRQHLVKDLGNEPTLGAIDSALFAVCLDSTSPHDIPDTVRQFLCGDPAHRWFDKCFQLIVSSTGQASVNFEHSWGDGIAVLRYMNEVRGDSTQKPAVSKSAVSTASRSAEGVKRLEFRLDARVESALAAAKDQLQQKLSKFEVAVARQPALSKPDIKAAGLSPDSVMQLAMQLAYHRLSGGQVAPTYESCSTAAFRHGRTETIRSATMETREACRLIGNSSTPSPTIIEAVRKCSTKHNQLTKEAAMGQGWDRHLMAMRLIAEMGMDAKRHEASAKGMASLPAIFTDPSYKKMNHIIVSTSTLSSPNIEIGGFGPVVPDGFGFGYGITDEEAGGCITAYRGDNKYSATQMAQCFEGAISSIANIVRAAAAARQSSKESKK